MNHIASRIAYVTEQIQILQKLQNVQSSVFQYFAENPHNVSWIVVQEMIKVLKVCEDLCLDTTISSTNEFENFVSEKIIAVFSNEGLCECIREAADIDQW
jgi:acyl-ACP thioesterase